MILLGVGPAQSPRFAPAGLLVEYGHTRVGIDGGPGSEPPETIEAWLVRDESGPLQADLRRIARESEMPEPAAGSFRHGPLHIDPLPGGYKITSGHHAAAWAPETADLPDWSRAADVVFADALEWARVIDVAKSAQRLGVRRLVFARLGGSVLEVLDRGEPPPFGEWGEEGRSYRM